MPIEVIGSEFHSKLKSMFAEPAYSVMDIDACIICGKPVYLEDQDNYVYDFDCEVICSGCTTVELKGEAAVKNPKEGIASDKDT